jgi:hypothetical protein
MERRKAVIAAATATLTLLAGAAAISLNTSLVGASGDDGVGRVSPVDTATTPETIYIDEPAAGQVPVRSGDDDEFDDDEFDDDEFDDDEFDDDHEDGQERNDDHGSGEDEHEYEGADDDD